METILNWVLGIGVFLLVLTISVAVHEWGHLSVAKAFKIPVPKYFVGFGPTLWSKKHKGTEYGVKAIPLGGFITVEDETQPEASPERYLLSYVSPWKRILVFLAGPAVNIVIGLALMFTLLVAIPMKIVSTEVNLVDSCGDGVVNCAAAEAGFQPGDKIVEVDGKAIESAAEMQGKFSPAGSEVVVLRGEERVTLNPKANAEGLIGVQLLMVEQERTPTEAFATIGTLFKMNLNALATVPEKVPGILEAITSGEREADTVSSVVGMGRVYGETADSEETFSTKAQMMLYYSAMLNLGLGLANLLPLLPLDGGRIVVAVFDSVKMAWSRLLKKAYSPTEYKWVAAMTAVTGALVFGFMLIVIIADIVAPVSLR